MILLLVELKVIDKLSANANIISRMATITAITALVISVFWFIVCTHMSVPYLI